MTSSRQNSATVLEMLDATRNRGDTSVLSTTVAEGLVTESWASFDRLALLQQLGVIPVLNPMRARPHRARQGHATPVAKTLTAPVRRSGL